MSVIAVYAPTLDPDNNTKDNFYVNLQSRSGDNRLFCWLCPSVWFDRPWGCLVDYISGRYPSTKNRVYGQKSPYFKIRSSVKQGCVLSPTRFNYAIDWISSKTIINFPGVKISPNFQFTDLDYADDKPILEKTLATYNQLLTS